MLGMFFHKSPFFKFETDDQLYTANMYYWGIESLDEIDYKKSIKKEDLKKYANMTPLVPFDIFQK
jgi:hypothetical protein